MATQYAGWIKTFDNSNLTTGTLADASGNVLMASGDSTTNAPQPGKAISEFELANVYARTMTLSNSKGFEFDFTRGSNANQLKFLLPHGDSTITQDQIDKLRVHKETYDSIDVGSSISFLDKTYNVTDKSYNYTVQLQ